ncbi:MAG: SdpI family protein [Bacteroidetes Order II. Incertae sedis bacterium]|nr:SdpI family protein [Bacteroidetes Order II. bacterium]MBT5249493.1 SdpI family protein [Bacteroidetes Order II. bacterium]MBT6424524.1 SdpI family protein [Bacteroidetes Order II. bacterium]MBT6580443.1 SdpI family protein [Bacteroidetes Order II. bacterium]MBT7401450.1 SdpI family protein [Bacteroidetes Order II. bacterium]
MGAYSNNLAAQMLEIVWLNPIFIVLAPTGLIFWLLGKWMLKHYPSKINLMSGYRTKRSMQSQEAWDHAQFFSAKLSIRIGKVEMLLGAFGIFASRIHETVQVVFAVFVVMYACIYLMVVTENELKRVFP